MADSTHHTWKYMLDRGIDYIDDEDNCLEITGTWFPDTSTVIEGVSQRYHAGISHRKFLEDIRTNSNQKYQGFVRAMMHHGKYDSVFHSSIPFISLCKEVKNKTEDMNPSLDACSLHLFSHIASEYLISRAVNESNPEIIDIMQDALSRTDLDKLNASLGENYGIIPPEGIASIRNIDFGELVTPRGAFSLHTKRYAEKGTTGTEVLDKLVGRMVNDDEMDMVAETLKNLEKCFRIDPYCFNFPI